MPETDLDPTTERSPTDASAPQVSDDAPPAASDQALPATTSAERLDQELAGLDALELGGGRRRNRLRRAWSVTWPKLGGIGIGLLLWQMVVWSGRWPEYVLPGPDTVLPELWSMLVDGTLTSALETTMTRAFIGYSIALVIGVVVGALVSQVALLRNAFGALITGLMTMPSIAWFPLAIVLFKLSQEAILFVVVLGAAPAIANGLISGADHVPPLLLRAGRVMGASKYALWRFVSMPASLPAFVGGAKQGWAFAWRSLMAGELLVIIANKPSVGGLLEISREMADYTGMMATMVLILIIGIVIDSLVFGTIERSIRRRWGLADANR